ncbi:sensor histidine kinase [Bacteroidota bacterium]
MDSKTLDDMKKDVTRLETITERFSKIGSIPELVPKSILTVLDESLDYMRSRSSKKVTFSLHANCDKNTIVPINVALFAWVIENLCRNAIDAMEGIGAINVAISESPQTVTIDISDTGKGIPRLKYDAIFQPGYTSKKRGWGLGLSLTKRIIEQYHQGKVFVKESEIGKGTTFRIVLNKA